MAGDESPVQVGTDALRFSDELFQAVVEFVPSGILMVDEQGRIALVNCEIERMFGFARDELIGSSVEMLIPQRLTRQHRDLRQSFNEGPSRRPMGTGRELLGLRKDGSEVPVEVGLNPVTTDRGRFVVASVVDVTERQRAKERFRILVEASPQGMLMVDARGRIVIVNQTVEEIFGYSRAELMGQSVDILLPPGLRGHHEDLRMQFNRDPSRRPMAGRDLVGRRRDGTEFPVEIGLSPVQTDDGVCVLASILDIGPRKKVEEELRRSNEELERFAYVASHDLQEPLRTVSSFVQLLARRYGDRLDTDATEFIEFAVGGVSRMQNLIADLLAFSRVGTRAREPVATAADVVVGHALRSLQTAIRESGVTVVVDSLPTVMVDPGQLEQVFTNLIGNAIKFRGEAPPVVHVGAVRDGSRWVFAVRDNGIGIDPQFNERIFVIFQRLNRREEYPGNGVGLAICKKIVERHGGRIWVEPSPDAGSVFQFSLPAVPE
ncbi:MAG: PAS domain S-box protein [Vicinamibacterales bacterium]